MNAVESAASGFDTVVQRSVIEVGNIQIDLDGRTLRRRGETIPVGSRAFDILVVLARANGRLVSKDQLMREVWPHTFVEENNIQVHLSCLRKLLGDERGLIVTVPGRGYQLSRRRHEPQGEGTGGRRNEAVVRMAGACAPIGREDALTAIGDLLTGTRVLTLVGEGGVGKSTLATEAARRFTAHSGEPAYIISLAGLLDRADVLNAIARQCDRGASAGSMDIASFDIASFVERLKPTRALLVFDNAEHVIALVAELVDALATCTEHVRVLVTSREPLRIMSERTFRVSPLDVPEPHASRTETISFASVQLFESRAYAIQAHLDKSDAQLRCIGDICRRLDGNPLAIELAAARLTALSLDDIHQRLDDPMIMLVGGYRTALPRHCSMQASFDWSYGLLDTEQQTLYRRISAFDDAFTLEEMCAAVCDGQLTVGRAVDAASALVAKSLLNVKFDGAFACYWLTNTARAYARGLCRHDGLVKERSLMVA
ncbi:ATP-binding protein [Caballeronia cordobensis]|uniref:ATP-binding protein n=1 Tax=Caballeronia cordobensis TaxID=1353886 RepID=UPI0006AD8320|nr:winged helix-turn-helix domain-containing protein [Caballeronia cordobensis]